MDDHPNWLDGGGVWLGHLFKTQEEVAAPDGRDVINL